MTPDLHDLATLSPRKARRRCRRMGHPTALAVALWNGDVMDVCHCARRDGLVRRYEAGLPAQDPLADPLMSSTWVGGVRLSWRELAEWERSLRVRLSGPAGDGPL